MGFGTSIIIGVLLGILIGVIPGILGLIPFLGSIILVCNCILSPLLTVIGGYLIGSMGRIRQGDWVGLAIQNAVYAFTATIVGTAASTLLTFLNIGANAVGGQQDVVGLGITAGAGIVGLIIGFFVMLVFTLICGFIGGAIYLLTAKK